VVTTTLVALKPALAAAGAHVVADAGEAPSDRPCAVLAVTGGTEQAILDVWRARQATCRGEPLVLMAHPAHNSLPASLEALARVQRDGGRGWIVVAGPEGAGTGELAGAMHDAGVWHRMHRARIGLLGTPSDWLVASVLDSEAVRRRWGVTIVDLPLAPVIDLFLDDDKRRVETALGARVRVGARHAVHAPADDDVATAARFEPVLQDVVATHHLDAVAVRCFDLVLDARTSGCLALSSINDQGVIAGCEGDPASTLALLWLRELTGALGWMANPSMIDRETGVVELAHCTVPLSLVDGYELDSHFESGLGVGISGRQPPGPVTVVRLGGSELEQLWCADGEALPTPRREGRCRTQLDVRVQPAAAAQLLDRPLGNHLVVVRGHHSEHVRRWFQSMIA
jgi:L-fucose isomerase-like protein